MSKRQSAPTKGEAGNNNDEKSSSSDTNAIEPMDNDVLFGRGDSINRHPGNKKFRELVDSHKRVYLASRFKQEKRMIANSIMSAVRNFWGGRFLAKDSNGQWQEVGDARAREKTLQALREKARSARTESSPPRGQGLSTETMGLPNIQGNTQPPMPERAGLPPYRSHQPDLSVGTNATPIRPGIPPAQASSGPSGGSHSSMIPSNLDYASFQAPTQVTLNPVASALPHDPAQTSNAGGRGNRSPLSTSQSTFVAAPLRPPPPLPSAMQPRRSIAATRKSHSERASLGQAPERRQESLDGTEVLPTHLSLTPRGQVPNEGFASSPVSAGTFDALQRVAFPESPGLDLFFASNSANHPFSPRRFPPTSQDSGLQQPQPVFAAPQVNLAQQLDSRHAPPPRQYITSQLSTSQHPPLSASSQQHEEAAAQHTMSNSPSNQRTGQPSIAIQAMQGPTSFVLQPHESTVRNQIQTGVSSHQPPEELPLPNPANQVQSPSLLHFMGQANPPSSRGPVPRGIPLPRATLAPRSRQEDRKEDRKED